MSGYYIPCPTHGNIKIRRDVERGCVTIVQLFEDSWEEVDIPLHLIDEFCRAVQLRACNQCE